MDERKRQNRSDSSSERLKESATGKIGHDALTKLVHELQVHQEELSVQNDLLIETQRALEDSRDRYVDLYDFAPIGYMTVDSSGIIQEMNLTGALVLQEERSKVIGLPFSAFLVQGDESRFSEHLRQCRQGDHASATVELQLRTGGPPVYVQLVTRRHGDADHGRSAFLSALIDTTERRLEEERRKAEEARDRMTRDREIARARADAKDHFLAALSHELRTPLTPIVAAMSNRRLLSTAPEPLRAQLETVRRNLDLEVRLIDDLLDVTCIARDRLRLAQELIDLHIVVTEVVEMLGQEIQERSVKVVLALDALMPWVVGDPTRLRQVFWNLFGNALKFTPAGGHVTISTTGGPKGMMEVIVTDTGIGMDAATLAAINDHGHKPASDPIPSTTGLGLGLAICQGVIAGHGGTLHATSAGRGSGSTLTARLPVAVAMPVETRPGGTNLAAAEGEHHMKRILLVEDHRDSAETLSQLLSLYDYDVTVAGSVEAALTVAPRGFDLLISDIRLPDGSGLDLMRRLRAEGPIRGIAISGFGTEQDVCRSRDAGYDVHLTKPLDFERLVEVIENVASGATATNSAS